MIETKKKIIDGSEFMVRQYGARLGGRIKIRIAKLVGPALATMMDAKKDQQSTNVQPEILEKALTTFMEGLSAEDYDSLIMQMIPGYVWKDEKEITEKTFDSEFAGNYSTLYKLLWFILEVNYGDFLELIGIGKDLQK